MDTNVKCDDGAITVTFTATDACGNKTTTSATYLIKDTTNPVLTVPVDVTIECTDDSTPAFTGSATATDDCSATTVSFNDVTTNCEYFCLACDECCKNMALVTIWQHCPIKLDKANFWQNIVECS